MAPIDGGGVVLSLLLKPMGLSSADLKKERSKRMKQLEKEYGKPISVILIAKLRRLGYRERHG